MARKPSTPRVRRFREKMTAVILANHRRIPPFGLEGGAPGIAGRNWVERTDGSRVELTACDKAEMNPGDVFVIQTPSAGGYGPPSTRRADDPVKQAAE